MTRTFTMISLAAGVFVTLAASPGMKSVVRLPRITLPAGISEKTIAIDVHAPRERLLAAARSRDHDVTLELDVEADTPPGVFYEVYLGAPKATRHTIGNVALFGAGIRSEARGAFQPAHVQLVITRAIATALHDRAVRKVELTFVPKGAEGIPAAKAKGAVTIVKAAIVIGPRISE